MKRLLVVLPPGGMPEVFAEEAVARAKDFGGDILALYVIDSQWSKFSAADWLSTGPSRASFDSYMHDTMLKEAARMADELKQAAELSDIPFSYETAEGDPAEVISEYAISRDIEVVLLSSTHPDLKYIKKRCGREVVII